MLLGTVECKKFAYPSDKVKIKKKFLLTQTFSVAGFYIFLHYNKHENG